MNVRITFNFVYKFFKSCNDVASGSPLVQLFMTEIRMMFVHSSSLFEETFLVAAEVVETALSSFACSLINELVPVSIFISKIDSHLSSFQIT